MYRILIVDDKEVFRRKLKRMDYFRINADKFFIAYEAQNGMDALGILENNKVDVVLTDIRMPFVDGIELLKIINERGLCRCVLLLSEFAEFNYAKEGILNGAFDYILKPVDEIKIREAFDRVYAFLNSITSEIAAEESDAELLSEFILVHDRMNLISCANRVVTKYRKRLDDPQFILSMQVLVDSIRRKLLLNRPYLEYYLVFPDRIIDLADQKLDLFLSHFTEHMLMLSDSISRLSIPEGDSQVGEACRILLNNPDGSVDLEEIAGQVYTNQKYLSALMKRETGKSAVRYVTVVKMERARKLLVDSDLRIGEIADKLGFEDIDYFSKVFRKTTGISPREYRRKNDER